MRYLKQLKISYRRSHTFEPNYVTPGRDATVSYEQPDFKFINTSSTAIGLRASYADQKMTVSVYGIPILEDGITWDLESKKVEDLGVPEPEYVEDQTLEPGVEKTTSKGSSGSRWETYKVVYKDGKEISRELDHKTTYKGHKPVIHRNTSGVVLNPEETTTQATTVTPTVDGMPEGYTGPAETTQSHPGSGTASSAPAEGPGAAPTEPSSVPVVPAPSEDTPSSSQGPTGSRSRGCSCKAGIAVWIKKEAVRKFPEREFAAASFALFPAVRGFMHKLYCIHCIFYSNSN